MGDDEKHLNYVPAVYRVRWCCAGRDRSMAGCVQSAGVAFALFPDGLELRSLYFQMENPGDWDIIRFDTSFDIEKPAYFWAEGETPIYVNIRRKSCDALPSESDPFKISIKVDINDYYCDPLDPDDPDCPGHPDAVADWHGLKKLSLENG
ncbi:MAG: hypothetical protein ACYSO3_09875, partial [Planctomycetota bacterium]